MVVVDDEVSEEGSCEEAAESKEVGEVVDVLVTEAWEFSF